MNGRAMGALLGAGILLAGCAGPGVTPPARVQAAIELNNRAVAAFAHADYPAAERFYLRAIEHERAIENGDGAAINLLGLALTYQRAGQTDAALRLARELAGPQDPPLSAERRAEAALLVATLLIGRADWPGAAGALDEVEIACRAPGCPLRGRLLNLRAQLAIVGNRLDEAADLATRAVGLAEESGDAQEEANALRTLANSRLFDRPGDGIAPVERALAIDRKLALSAKIYQDLALHARLLAAGGQRAAARRLLARARSVAQADRNAAGLREIAVLEQETNTGENDEK